jgi:hypothetical protein
MQKQEAAAAVGGLTRVSCGGGREGGGGGGCHTLCEAIVIAPAGALKRKEKGKNKVRALASA